ncbi:carboxylesterase/lipase family protein [Microbacterium terricola]|uniref:Carboxylic ester hydrolase n=1 Tax=Microbacterium terricola TaxID=344163 RepID=A0ABM8E2L8_9MICO|nr:carboxylesterase family protein [Microbacterium terricola]UYK40259.1 carboxylesterase family protein [Microbacterium terricola]BDV32029.1 carboxylic ester hydrolase [Microbacterium terricola]
MSAEPSASTAGAAPVVRIGPGEIRGFWRDEARSSAAFLGIPFAQAAVGGLRFAAPVPPEPWEGVRDAIVFGATAQRGDPGITLIPEPSVPGASTLNVNVFTPSPGTAGAQLPVLVYIHGGGYVAGSPASPWYDGAAFARDGVVTVVVSYRLGFDGFGHIAGAPSNRGVRDWLLALEWVQQNVAAFGGDPARVTIAGQSAGGGAVLTLLGMPAAQHLFHGVWALSGAIANVTPERARTLSAKLAHLAGVVPTRDGFAGADEQTLIDLQEKAISHGSTSPMAGVTSLLHDGLSWGPMIDGDLIAEPTIEALRSGIGADKPLVLGATDDEFSMALDGAKGKLRLVPAGLALGRLLPDAAVRKAYLAANTAQRRKGTAAVLGRFVSDWVFRRTVVQVAEARGVAPTWAYRFAWASPVNGWACHCLDVPFWFDVLDAEGVGAIAGPRPPRGLAAASHGSAVAFIRDGDPGWTPWSAHPGIARVFDADATSPDVQADAFASARALV